MRRRDSSKAEARYGLCAFVLALGDERPIPLSPSSILASLAVTLSPTSPNPRVMSVTTSKEHHVEDIINLLRGWTDYAQTLTIDAGETHSVDSGAIERYSTIENAGTLENAGTVDSGLNPWRTTAPTIRAYWEDAQGEKGPGAGQPAIAYVWSPADSTLDRFSIDDTEMQQSNTVEVQVWSLDPTEPVTLQEDITRILSTYLDDNNVDTPYSTVEPVVESDFREQKNARSTDYYITAVEIETEGLTRAGVA